MTNKTLISAQEVVDLAFTTADQIKSTSINDTKIEAAQEKFIRPAVGALYDALIAGKYEALVSDYIKPALAYWVKYTVIPDLSIKIGDKGANVFTPDHAQAATDKQRAEQREQARDDAQSLMNKAIRHIEANTDMFPEYDLIDVPNKGRRFYGGLVL